MRRLARIGTGLGACVAVALLIPSLGAAQHFPEDEDLAVMLRYLVEDGETPGIVLGVLERDGSTRVLSYGTGGEGARPLGPRSVFELASVTKTFTAAVLAEMVERGEVALDDPVARYLPDHVRVPSRGGRRITLLDLATHTSGLPSGPADYTPPDPDDPYGDFGVEDLYAFLSGHELSRKPGEAWEYSNLGYGLLAHALARAAGTDVRSLLRKRILDPLGMDMTRFELEGDVAEWMVRGHRRAEVVPWWFGAEGSGGLRSNAEDMLKYLKANVGRPETELERAMRAAHEARIGSGRPGEGQGLGWRATDGAPRMVTHGGGSGGFESRISFLPEQQLGYVLFTNESMFQDDFATDLLRRGVLDLPVVEVAESELERYAGEYEMAPGQAIVVRLEADGWLTLQVPGTVRARLYPTSDTTFYQKRRLWRHTFVVDRTGRVEALLTDLGSSVRRAARISDRTPPPREVAGNARGSALPVTAEDIARYAGTYELQGLPAAVALRIWGEDGVLMAQTPPQDEEPLIRTGENAFALSDNTNIRIVFDVVEGRAVRATLHMGGRAIEGRRKR